MMKFVCPQHAKAQNPPFAHLAIPHYSHSFLSVIHIFNYATSRFIIFTFAVWTGDRLARVYRACKPAVVTDFTALPALHREATAWEEHFAYSALKRRVFLLTGKAE
jgi:hypothetical protein